MGLEGRGYPRRGATGPAQGQGMSGKGKAASGDISLCGQGTHGWMIVPFFFSDEKYRFGGHLGNPSPLCDLVWKAASVEVAVTFK